MTALPRNAAERDAARDRRLAESARQHDDERAPLLKKLKQCDAAHAARDVAVQAQHSAYAAALSHEHVEAGAAELAAVLDSWQPTRECAAALIDVCCRRMLIVDAELGAKWPLDLHIGNAFKRREVAARPNTVNWFGNPDTWKFNVLRLAYAVADVSRAVLSGLPLTVVDAVTKLQLAIESDVSHVPRDAAIDPHMAARHDARLRHLTAEACDEEIRLLELQWRAEHDAAAKLAWDKHRDEIRRYRSGELAVGEDKPAGWAEGALAVGTELFGPLAPGMRREQFDGARW